MSPVCELNIVPSCATPKKRYDFPSRLQSPSNHVSSNCKTVTNQQRYVQYTAAARKYAWDCITTTYCRSSHTWTSRTSNDFLIHKKRTQMCKYDYIQWRAVPLTAGSCMQCSFSTRLSRGMLCKVTTMKTRQQNKKSLICQYGFRQDNRKFHKKGKWTDFDCHWMIRIQQNHRGFIATSGSDA